MRILSSTAIIIKKRDFLESDMIVTLLGSDGMRFEAIAKGALNGTSRRKNHIEIMNLISGTFFRSKNHIYLQTVQCESSFPTLKKNLEQIFSLSYILEIIEKTILENDPHPEIYSLLLETLTQANKEEISPNLIESTLIKLAKHLGFLPSFKSCSSCHKTLDEDTASWDPNSGTLHCASCGKEHFLHMPLKYRKALDFFQKAPRSECEKVFVNSEEKNVLKAFIPKLFESHMDSPLKSLMQI
ncbi:DNA repair protein RecO [Patescibacteria group bacterium]|nr:DNA repair protein RecO [Patescibacteria group bacterium]